ncbi:MAG: hypothetical protein R3D00_22785 [Bacteroidia bacterium]
MKEITEIIEIVFERVKLEKIVEILIRKLSESTLKKYNIIADSSEFNLESKEMIFDSINRSSDGAFVFTFSNFSLKDIFLSQVWFRIDKYDNIYDLSLDIEEKEIRQKTSISDLQKRVASLAEELKTNSYYCGYEPATDEETRLFSVNILGPLNNWGNMDN